MPEATMAPRYATRFKCLGSDCEDTCCQGWDVTVDAKAYRLLNEQTSASPALSELIKTRIPLLDARVSTPRAHALIEKGAGGDCPFLDPERLCSIHSELGENHLPDICSTFPRRIQRAGDAVELTGQFACPEMARLGLLAGDAMMLEPFDLTSLPSNTVHQSIDSTDTTPYTQHVNEIRSLMVQLLTQIEYTVDQRLFFQAFFAHRTASFFHAGATEDVTQALDENMQFMLRPAVQMELADRLDEFTVPSTLVMTLAREVVQSATSTPSAVKCRELTKAALTNLGASSRDGNDTFEANVEEMWQLYNERKQQLYNAMGNRVEQYFLHFALNFWLSNWYTRSPSLQTHLQHALIETSVLKLLLVGHPTVVEALEAFDGTEEAIPALHEAVDRAAVEVFYLTARSVEHSNILIAIDERLAEMGIQSLGATVALLKF